MHGQMILIDKEGEIYNGKLILEYEDGKIHSEGNISFGDEDWNLENIL